MDDIFGTGISIGISLLTQYFRNQQINKLKQEERKALLEDLSKLKPQTINILTVNDIQKVLKIGKAQAYELVNANGFPSIRIGGKILVEQRALENWLDKNKGRKILL